MVKSTPTYREWQLASQEARTLFQDLKADQEALTALEARIKEKAAHYELARNRADRAQFMVGQLTRAVQDGCARKVERNV